MIKAKEDNKKELSVVLKELEKQFNLSTASKEDLTVVDSGSYTINRATGVGGYPLGKLIELYGPESSGKSTILLHAIKAFQKAIPERKVALFDYEHSWDRRYAKSVGVDIDNVLIYQPDSQEQGYNMILGLVENSVCSLILIDSHTSAIPLKIIEGEMGDVTMGLQARNNSKFLGKVKGAMDRSKTTIIATSQTRSNIGGMGNTGDVSTGGNAWKFYADMRFKVWKSLDKPNELNKTTLDVIKNKCEKPFGKAEFNIDWGFGVDNVGEIIDMAVEYDIVVQSGSWFSYGETKIGQGKEKVKALLADHPDLLEEIKNKVINYENLEKKNEGI